MIAFSLSKIWNQPPETEIGHPLRQQFLLALEINELKRAMARLGAFCFPGTGHLNPMTAKPMMHPGHAPEAIHFPPAPDAGSRSCAEIREPKSQTAKITLDIGKSSTTIWLWIDWV
jgi:hypothetical protein